MDEGANYVPSLREYTARWGVTPEPAPPRPERDAPGPDEPRRRDRPARRRLGGGARRRPGARRARRPDGGALRPAHDRARSPSRRAAAGGRRDCLVGRDGADDVVIRGARVLDPTEGVDARDRRAHRRRRDLRSSARSSTRTATGSSTATGSCSRRRSSTRTCTCARRAARTRRRSRPARRPPRRAATARSSRSRTPIPWSTRPTSSAGCARARADEAEVPVGFMAAITKGQDGRGAHRDGRARRRGRGRLHRRRPPGRDRRADAPRAPVQRDHRPAARAPLRGADA